MLVNLNIQYKNIQLSDINHTLFLKYLKTKKLIISSHRGNIRVYHKYKTFYLGIGKEF